jgi:hypothetical protein
MRAPRTAETARAAAAVTLAAAVLTAIMAVPVLRDPGTRIFGTEIVGRHLDAYTVIAQFERPGPLTPHSQLLTDLPGAALARRTGGIVAYNVIVLFSFPLAALTAFLFVHRLTGRRRVAAVAALGFTFSPFHLAHAAYHPHVAQVQWLPLYLLALWLCLERFTATRACLLGAAAVVAALTNFYGGFIAAAATPVAVAVFWFTSRRQTGAEAARHLRKTTALLAAIALAGAAYVVIVRAAVPLEEMQGRFPADDLRRYGALWWAYLLPSVEHPLAGEWARTVLERAGVSDGLLEQQVSLPLPLVALAFVAVAGWLRAGRDWAEPAVPVMLALGAVGACMSLAPGQYAAGVPIPAPAVLLHEVAPMFRSYARFGVLAALAVAALAGIGAAGLWDGATKAGRLAVVVCLAAAALELPLAPPWRSHDVLPTRAHRFATTLVPDARIIELATPTKQDQSLARLLGRPMAFLTADIAEVADPRLAETLAGRGFTHAIYRRPSDASRVLESRPLRGFHELQSFPDGVVLAVAPAGPPLAIRWDTGFYPREQSSEGSWRWMRENGRWTVINSGRSPIEATLEVEIAAFPGARDVEVSVNYTPYTTLRVEAGRSRHRLGPLVLRPEGTGILFQTTTPPVVAHSILGNGDPRSLSIAIWDWHWTANPENGVR